MNGCGLVSLRDRTVRPRRARLAMGRPRLQRGFTLIEILVVVSIIALLAAIALPAFSSARNSAKNTTTKVLLKSITQGLEMFRTDNEKQFRRSGGYPASHKAEDPALPGAQDIYGAHWLVRGLLGQDLQGFIPRVNVPLDRQDRDQDRDEQVNWYDPKEDPIERGRYFPLDTKDLMPTGKLSGTRNIAFFPPGGVDNARDVDHVDDLSVFVDAFRRPVLYYAANPYGRVLASETTDTDAEDRSGIYVHEDNEGFTGRGNNHGWRFRGRERFGWLDHNIQQFGDIDPSDIDDQPNTFARYVADHRFHERSGESVVRPFRPDSFLLITAGEDGLYGTTDDVNNFER